MPDDLLTGSELCLVAQVPKGSDRWSQIHFNAKIVDTFFRLDSSASNQEVVIERVDLTGRAHGPRHSPLVFSSVNKNLKLEFDVGQDRDYPQDGVPLLIILELEIRDFRYVLLRPGNLGYAEMLALNLALQRVGRGLRRVVTTLDEVELRWPACPLRSPRRD